MFITQAVQNKAKSLSGVTERDNRGWGPPANKISEAKLLEVRNHINSYPLYESHYSRRKSNKKYLPSFLNLQILYDAYKEFIADNPVSRTI